MHKCHGFGVEGEGLAGAFGVGGFDDRAEDDVLEGWLIRVDRIALGEVIPPGVEPFLFVAVDALEQELARRLLAIALVDAPHFIKVLSRIVQDGGEIDRSAVVVFFIFRIEAALEVRNHLVADMSIQRLRAGDPRAVPVDQRLILRNQKFLERAGDPVLGDFDWPVVRHDLNSGAP